MRENAQQYSRPFERQRIGAVIVTHDTGQAVQRTLEAAAAIADICVIVDNASEDDTLDYVRQFVEQSTTARYVVEHPVNNLAKAQNLGIQHVLGKGCEWVLLLDHDSVPDREMVVEMLRAYRTDAQPQQVGMLVPNITDRHSRRKARYVRHLSRWMYLKTGFGNKQRMDDVMLAIASGSLIPADTLRQVGMMDESLCIDQVDYDFSLRMIEAGLRIVAVRSAMLHHQLGHCRDNRVLGACVTTSNHSAERRYYIYRNRLALWRKHGRNIPAYVIFDICAILYDVMKIACFEEDRVNKFRAMGAGIRDALRGRYGMASGILRGTLLLPNRQPHS